MKIRLKNSRGERTVFALPDKNIVIAVFQKMMGSEVLRIIYDDSSYDKFDTRAKDFWHIDYDECTETVCKSGVWEQKFLKEHEVR